MGNLINHQSPSCVAGFLPSGNIVVKDRLPMLSCAIQGLLSSFLPDEMAAALKDGVTVVDTEVKPVKPPKVRWLFLDHNLPVPHTTLTSLVARRSTGAPRCQAGGGCRLRCGGHLRHLPSW